MSLWAIHKNNKMNQQQSTYHRVKQFIENELHMKLPFYQDMILKNMLDEEVQKHLQEMYKEE